MVVVYSIPYCPFCVAAKSLLARKGVDFTDNDLGHLDDETLSAYVAALTGGRSRTVPQIWIDETYVGGCDQLLALDARGELDRLLSAEPTVAEAI